MSIRQIRRLAGGVFAACSRGWIALLLFIPSAPTNAAGVVGNGTPASCTFAAISTAIAAGNGTITFACGAAPVTVANPGPGPLLIPNGTQIVIDGGNAVTLSGAGAYQIFLVSAGATLTLKNLIVASAYSFASDGGAIFNNGTLSVDGCTFNQNVATNGYSGGAIVSYGPLTISNSTFHLNQGANGGAVYTRFPAAVMTITDTTFDTNVANDISNGWGGAILLWDGAPATLTRVTLNNNSARFSGGAIFVQGASGLTIHDSQFNGNFGQAAGSYGGGIFNQGSVVITGSTFQTNHAGNGGAIFMGSGTIGIQTSLFHHNWAYYGGAYGQGAGALTATNSWFDGNGYDQNGAPLSAVGGAIVNGGGTVTLTNLTLSGNYALAGGGYDQFDDINGASSSLTNVTITGNTAGTGGGMKIESAGSSTLTNVTVYQNISTVSAGGIWAASAGQVTLRNSIVANSTGVNCNVAPGTSDSNLSNDGTCGFGAGRDNVSIQLAALSNTGGFAPTHVPLPGSPAIDNASPLTCPFLDQRGVVRGGKGTSCDVGAVEYVGLGFGIDVDGNGTYDAQTDGLLIIRYLLGLRGAALTSGALGVGATRNAAQIQAYIQSLMQ